jgi:2-methylcitrate dehydratase
MNKVEFAHDPTYDDKYPEGLPTRVEITNRAGEVFDSDLVMFPGGHAENEDVDLIDVLQYKFFKLGSLAMEKEDLKDFIEKIEGIDALPNEDLDKIYECDIKF